MNNIRIIALFLIISGFNVATQAQKFETKKLNNYFEALNDNNKFMGNVSVFRDGVEIYSKSVGFADIDYRVPNSKLSKSCIGSISKTFTAVMVFQAVEAGKLSLAETINNYFPSIKNADKITIAHLLGHRSGIHSYTENREFMKWQAKSRGEMIEVITKGGSDFEPDATADYSNSNYVLLSYTLESVYRKSYADILKDNITRPLSLDNTYFGSNTIDLDHNESNSYLYSDKWAIQTVTEPSVTLGAGCIVSTPVDLNKFADALFGGKLISVGSLSTMLDIRDDYGMGISFIPYFSKQGYGHRSGIDGFNSMLIYMPEDKISYAITSNGLNCNFIEIHLAVLNYIFGRPFDIQNSKKVTIKPKTLDKYIGVYVNDQLPLKVTVTKTSNSLLLEVSGQPSLLLEAVSEHIFRFPSKDIVVEFNATNRTMVLIKGEEGILYFFKTE